MTLLNTETGELLDTAAAERRAERISLRLDAIADNYAAVMPMIRDAIEKRDDLALGYRSPGDYVSDRFGGALRRLGGDVSRVVVGELTDAGLSQRAIAPIIGVTQQQVSKYVSQLATRTGEPEGSAVLAVDSRLRQVRRNRAAYPQRAFVALLIKGWNYYARGAEVTTLTMSTDARIPEPSRWKR